MVITAVGCAIAAALCYAGANHLQHSSVRKVSSDQSLSVSGAWTMLRTSSWLWSLLLLIFGASLHVYAVTQAPLVVVQPIGVLTLVVAPLLAGVRFTKGLYAALAMTLGGVAGVVALSSMAPVLGMVPNLAAVQLVPLGAVALALAATYAGPRGRGLMQACAGAIFFGFTTSLVRVVTQAQLGELLPLVLAEIAAGAVAGAWLVHQAHAKGSSAMVAGATTIVDPLIAVLIGVFAYHESPASLLAYVAVPALVAIIGLIVLARVSEEPATRERGARRAGPMRVVVAADTYPPNINGASHFAHRLATGLAGHGHEVHVICPSTTNTDTIEVAAGVTVHRIGALRTPFHPTFRICTPWRVGRAVPRLLADIDPDLVHSQAHFVVGRRAVRAGAAAGIPVVSTNHFMPENLIGYGPLPRWTHRLFTRLAWWDLTRVFRHSTAVTAPTPRAVELLERNGFEGAATAISCGIDRTHFAPAESRSTVEPTVLFVGRLDAEKNVHELLEAAAGLSKVPRVELVGDGSERDSLEHLAARLGIAERVTFRGFVTEDELLRAYQSCTVFCMPGTAELQSLATMEAMAAGKPVIAADAMALPHLVRPGHNGWLYQPGDIAGLTVALSDILGDESAQREMGLASVELIGKHDIQDTLRRFEQLYADVLGRSAETIDGMAGRGTLATT